MSDLPFDGVASASQARLSALRLDQLGFAHPAIYGRFNMDLTPYVLGTIFPLCNGRSLFMKTLREVTASLPKKEQKRINARAKELIAEEMSLQSLRKAHRKTQKSMATQLGIGQDSVSRLEQRSDMLLSTLRDYVEAMGGTIRLLAEFKGAAPIELTGLGTLIETKKAPRKRIEPRRRTFKAA